MPICRKYRNYIGARHAVNKTIHVITWRWAGQRGGKCLWIWGCVPSLHGFGHMDISYVASPRYIEAKAETPVALARDGRRPQSLSAQAAPVSPSWLRVPPIGKALAFGTADRAAGALDVINPELDAVAVAEIKFGKVSRQMALVTMLLHPDHAPLEDRDVTFNGVR